MDEQTKQVQLQRAIEAQKKMRQVVTILDSPTSPPSMAEKMTPTLQNLRQSSLIEPWQCPDCGEDVLPGSAEDHRGQVFYYPRSFCDCQAGLAKKEAHERETARDEWESKAQKLLEGGGLNYGKYAHFLFKTWDAYRTGSNASEALGKVNDYIDRVAYAPRQWLYLYGPYGNGKTHLGVAALRKLALTHLWRPHIIVWPELCQATKESWSKDHGPTEAVMWGKARGAKILLLDDLDKTATSEWAMSKLFGLINSRAVAGLPTIITANKSLSALKVEWGRSNKTHVQDTGLAVLSRIADELWGGVRFEGEDQRWVR